MKTIKCKLCSEDFSIGSSIEEHLINDHNISYSKYYEYYKTVDDNESCGICGHKLHRLSPWFEIYNSCELCNNKLYFESVMSNIDKAYNILCNDSFMKIWILDKSIRDRLINFNLVKYSELLNNKVKGSYDKINLFKLSVKPGLSPYIGYDLRNIVIEDSEFSFKNKDMVMCDNHYRIKINNSTFDLYPPELIEYHNNNHYKYNILNRSNSPQSSKRLLLSSGNCIKFYNTNLDRCKSLIKIEKNGVHCFATSLTEEELKVIKFYIMSNTSLFRYILDIIYRIIRNSDTVYDSSFLLNKILVNPQGKFNMIIDWTINSRMISSDKELLSISIL